MAGNRGCKPEIEEEICRRYADEVDNMKMCEELGITRNQLSNISKKHHLKKTPECMKLIYIAQHDKTLKIALAKHETEEWKAKQAEKERIANERHERWRIIREEAKRKREEKEAKRKKLVPIVHSNAWKIAHGMEVKQNKPKPVTEHTHFRYTNPGELEKPKSNEPCIGKKCRCYRFCFKNVNKEQKYCDAYMYLEFTSEMQRDAVIHNMI